MEDPAEEYTAADGTAFTDVREYQNYAVDSYYDEDGLDEDDLPPYDASNRYVHSDESDIDNNDDSPEYLNEYITDLKAKANSPRPQSAPAGRVANARGEIAVETFTPHESGASRVYNSFSEDNEVKISETLKIPHSPYDEEVAFEYTAGDDEELDSAYLDSRRGGAHQSSTRRISTSSNPKEEPDWAAENRRFLMASTDAHIPDAPTRRASDRPRPSSADPRLRHSTPGYMAPRTGSVERGRGRHSLSGGPPRARSSTPKRGRDVLRASAEKLTAMKELVEDLVRNTVKKADLYHTIQVSLGFIDNYTMVPARGAIITSKKKTWLTARDLQSAFTAARLCLTEAQLIILRSLVYAFAQQYDTLYASTARLSQSTGDLATGLADSHAGALSKKGVFGPSQTLSATWLKRYLLHLRLGKKVSTVTPGTGSVTGLTASAASVGSVAGGVGTSAGGQDDKSPLPWSEWLGKKLQHEVARDSGKPKEFEKALNGLPHPLCKEDVELMLKTYSVLPPEILQKEVECRIESWLLDMDGRRDFQHALNVKIRRWIWTKKIKEENVKLPKNEKGYWLIWQKLPEDEKKSVKASILSTIIQEKRAELLSQERTKQVITKELYWKYDAERQRREGLKWKNWLDDHIEKFKRDLDDFRASEQDRHHRVAELKAKRKTMAGLNEVQDKLKKAQEDFNMDTHHQMELQKAINALRRAAVVRGVAKGTVITKEDFDTHVKGVLAPYITLDAAGNIREVDTPAGGPPARGLRQSDIQGLFHQELKAVVDKVVELETERTVKSTQVYQSWLAEKVRVKEEQRQKKLQEEEAKKKEQAARQKIARKEYRKWLRLRSKDKYKSRVDNKAHPLPEARVLSHAERWNSDKELHEYYADQERKL